MTGWDRLEAEAAGRGLTPWCREHADGRWGAWAFDEEGELRLQVLDFDSPQDAASSLADELHAEPDWSA